MFSTALSQQWPWNKIYLRLYLILFSLLAIIFTVALYPSLGLNALYFLLGIPTGFFIRLHHARTGSKVNTLMNCKSAQNGEVVESLLSIGQHQSPGVAILRDDVLILIPIVGRRRKIQLNNINSVKQSSWLAGKYLWGKTALLLETNSSTQLALALPRTIATRWQQQITD
ncbi:MAG: hypothetical protein OQL06_09845 [Gammaproteobacteria bacterium]|nr:hypothetical protein [Gammaproteobacteria bacterium]